MKKTALISLIACLLPQLASACGLTFGEWDWTGNWRYYSTCIELASSWETREGRNEQYALCMLQRNSITNLLTCKMPQEIQSQPVERGSIQDTMRLVTVDFVHNDDDPKYDDDGRTDVTAQQIMLMVAEMCDHSDSTPFVDAVRICRDRSTSQLKVCLCANSIRPQSIKNLEAYIRDSRMINYIQRKNWETPIFECAGLVRLNKRSASKRSTDDSGGGDDDDAFNESDCYAVYENGDWKGVTGNCDDASEFPYVSGTAYSHYEILASSTWAGPPSASTSITRTSSVTIPAAVLQPVATNAAESAAQARLSAATSGASPTNPAATPTNTNSAAGSLRHRQRGSLQVAVSVMCLVFGAYVY